MDDNPFANPFADDSDPTANPFAALPSNGLPSGPGIHSPGLASYTSGFDASSRRVSVASAHEPATPGTQDTEESPYLRKLERDGVISGITSPSTTLQGNPFSTTRTAPHDETDAFKGGFYSPPAFQPSVPSTSQQAFAIGEPAISPERSTDERGHAAQESVQTQQDDLEALGLAPAQDPTAGLKAAFIKHPARPAESPQEPEKAQPIASDSASPAAEAQPPAKPAARTQGLSAGARRRKKVVGISVDNVERERERERERLEREAVRKAREETERREKEGPKEPPETHSPEKPDDTEKPHHVKKPHEEPHTPLEAPTAAEPDTQPPISSTRAEQILLSSTPGETSHAIAQQLDHSEGDALRALPALPPSEGTTRTATPEPASTSQHAEATSETVSAPLPTHGHAHPGVTWSHLDPVVTSPLDGSTASIEPQSHGLSLGAREEPGRSSWGRAFDEDESQPPAVQAPLSATDGPASAGWTTDLPTGSSDRGGVWTSPGAQGDGWAGKDGYPGVRHVSPSLAFLVAHVVRSLPRRRSDRRPNARSPPYPSNPPRSSPPHPPSHRKPRKRPPSSSASTTRRASAIPSAGTWCTP